MINIDWIPVGECQRNLDKSTHLSTESIGLWTILRKVIEPQHKLRQRGSKHRTREEVAPQDKG